MGGLASNYIYNLLNSLGLLLYSNYLGMDPVLAGMALLIPRLFDAITDPIIGNLSDNFKSRWGRRKPFMIPGVIACAVMMPLFWTPPFPDTINAPWYANGPFWYLAILGCAYSLAYTFFMIPWTAMGYELTPDYDERTRVLAWQMYIGLFGSMTIPWMYRFCLGGDFGPFTFEFGDALQGALYVSIAVGLIVLVTGLAPAFACPEIPVAQKQPKIHLLEALRCTIANRAFAILLLAYVVVIVSIFSAASLLPFVFLYYVFGGNEIATGDLTGQAGTLGAVIAYVSMFLVISVSAKTTKRKAMIIGLSLGLLGAATSYWALDPRWPLMIFVPTVISALGMQGCWLMVSSMVADICDEDELLTGRRREGMFSAAISFALKASQALTFVIGGILLKVSGFDASQAKISGVSVETGLAMKDMVVGFQVVGFIIAIIAFWFYPISRERSVETRRRLESRRGELEASLS